MTRTPRLHRPRRRRRCPGNAKTRILRICCTGADAIGIAAALRLAHQPAEDLALLAELGEELGMPLDADDEAGLDVLDRLDDAVAVAGGCDDVRTERVDRLAMQRVD